MLLQACATGSTACTDGAGTWCIQLWILIDGSRSYPSKSSSKFNVLQLDYIQITCLRRHQVVSAALGKESSQSECLWFFFTVLLPFSFVGTPSKSHLKKASECCWHVSQDPDCLSPLLNILYDLATELASEQDIETNRICSCANLIKRNRKHE